MADVLLLHHAQGCTPGVHAFAEDLRGAGHSVRVPDLYDGRTFDDLDAGIAYAKETGFGTIAERGVAAAEGMPSGVVYAGMSLGVMPAQRLAQTRAGAAGALLLESCVPPEEFGGPWPSSVPVQVHGMDADPIFAGEGDLDAARALVADAASAELFVYPGERHLFTDRTLDSYDEAAARLLTERVIGFLDAL